jgi:hypothetical protein
MFICVLSRYGDRIATTIPGRIFSIIWTLYGLVITGILVGNLTSALTASVAFAVNEVDLYQAKVIHSWLTSVFATTISRSPKRVIATQHKS